MALARVYILMKCRRFSRSLYLKALGGSRFVFPCTRVVRPSARKCFFRALKRSCPKEYKGQKVHVSQVIIHGTLPIPCRARNVFMHTFFPLYMKLFALVRRRWVGAWWWEGPTTSSMHVNAMI